MSRHLITRAIRQCVLDWPRLATTLLRLDPREKPGIGTVAVDQHLRLYYDSDWVAECSFDDLVFFIKQEVVHPLLGHGDRSQRILGNLTGKQRQYVQEQLNIAADCAVHGFMSQERQFVSSKAVRPQDCISVKTDSPLPDGLSLEDYFSHLFDRDQMNQLVDVDLPDGPDGPDDGEKVETGDITTSGHKGGSGADGEKRGYEDDYEPPKIGDNDKQDKSSGVSDHDLDELGDDFLEGSNSRGNGGDRGRGLRAGKIKPKLTPEQLIRMAVVRASNNADRGFDAPTYRRQSRRMNIDSDLIRPSYEQHKPSITVVVDTSGSMGQRDLDLAAGVLEVALKGLNLNSIRVVMADWRVQSNCEVTDLRSVKFEGGGGTNMHTVCDQIANDHARDTDLLICVTDGETPWPQSRKVPMVAAITRSGYYTNEDIPSHMKRVNLY